MLAIAIDPFTQQIVHYKDCAIPLPGFATIPRTNLFVGGPGAVHLGASEMSIAPGVNQAIVDGAFRPRLFPSSECLTGNCTWSTEYSTLAWCSSCHNITEQLSITNNTFIVSGDQDEQGYAGYTLNTSVPGGISVLTSSAPTADGAARWQYAAMGPAPDADSMTGSIDFIISAKSPEICENPERVEPSLKSYWACIGPAGIRCSFSPCVKTFTASVTTGQLKETLIATGSDWAVAESGGNGLTMLDIQCLNPNELQSLIDLNYTVEANQRFVAYNLSMDTDWDNLEDTFPTSMILRECLYTTSLTFLNSMTAYFNALLNGTITGAMPTPYTAPGVFSGPQILQSFFDYGNATQASIADTFANISTSLTNYMRENGIAHYSSNATAAASTPARGTAQVEKICISVRWGFLVYPTALVVSTLVFFILLLIETWPTGSRPDIWKSSPLALLFHGLPNEAVEEISDNDPAALDQLSGMEEVAKSISVKLSSSENGHVQLL